MPDRTTFSRTIIPDLYNEVHEKIKNKLSKVLYASFTLDMWSSLAKQDYMSLTVHFFEDDFSREELCLEVVPFTHTHHTAVNIASFLNSTLQVWNIDQSQIHCVVTDSAKNMILGMKEAQVKGVQCTAHTLQLVINNALVSQRNVSDMCARARKVVGHFQHSIVANKKLIEFQKFNNLPTNRLLQDEVTRWDSTYLMLQRLFEQRKAVMFLLPEFNLMADLSSNDWNLIENLLPSLEVFHRATLALSSSQMTVSEVIPIVNGLKLDLEEMSGSGTSVKHIAKTMLFHLNSYYSDVEQNDLFTFATILDPRFKTTVFSEAEVAEAARQKLSNVLAEVTEQTDGTESRESKVPKVSVGSQSMVSVYSRLIAAKTQELSHKSFVTSPYQQLQQYLAEPLLSTDGSPFAYWKITQYNALKKLALKYLTPPAASSASERLFSTAGLVCDRKRSALNPEKVRMLVFLNKNLKHLGVKGN